MLLVTVDPLLSLAAVLFAVFVVAVMVADKAYLGARDVGNNYKIVRHVCPIHQEPLYLAMSGIIWHRYYWTDKWVNAQGFNQVTWHGHLSDIPYRWLKKQRMCWDTCTVETSLKPEPSPEG